jgi:hypothetical protein
MSYWWTRTVGLFENKTALSGPRKTAESTFERTTASKPQRMKDGYIWAEGMISPRPCTIRDMTVLEAEVALWHDDIKPSLLRGSLKLFSCADGREVDCTVAGRKGDTLGLRFTSTFHAPSRRYA